MLRTILWWMGSCAKSRKKTFWMQARFLIYKNFIFLLKQYYRRYAISDTLVIDGIDVIIVQECRDLEFEDALHLLGVDTTPKLIELSDYPHRDKISFGYQAFLHFFHFTHSLRIYIDNKKIVVSRSQDLDYCNDDIPSLFKMSIQQDVIRRTWLKCQATSEKSNEGNSTLSHNKQHHAYAGVEIDDSF